MHNERSTPDQADCPDGHDAICFTAGAQGLQFGAGVIHAYLAADRKAPVVVAGISAGALNSAAMYQAYAKFQKEAITHSADGRESRRWEWFRSYIEHLTHSPFDPIWDAIPNPVDFFAESTPVEDPSCPPELKKDETEARNHYLRLIRLGNWLSGLHVSVADLADLVVRYVRWKEGYAIWPLQLFLLAIRAIWVACLLAVQVAIEPRMIWRTLVYDPVSKQPGHKVAPQPLFGWMMWSMAVAWLIVSCVTFVLAVSQSRWWLAATCVLILSPLLFAKALTSRRNWLLRLIIRPVKLETGLFHNYHLQRALRGVFEDAEIKSPQDGGPCHLLVVAAPLNAIPNLRGGQLWAGATTKKFPSRLRDALTAALTIPGLLRVYRAKHSECWIRGESLKHRLKLVDGVVVRSNPIPALFNWIDWHWKKGDYRTDIEKLFYTETNQAAALRVVYAVPIQPLSRQQELHRESVNIVENGFISLSLQRRRDTEMESRQTEFMSQLEGEIRAHGTKVDPMECRHPILPLPISPEVEIKFQNPIDPTREEGLRQVANGCRRTLESIYRHRLAGYGDGSEVECEKLLADVAADRKGFIRLVAPGLKEVCSECTRKLQVRPVETSEIDKSVPSYGKNLEPVHEIFPQLTGTKSRIVFLANGGVFRGSFHIGVAAALQLAKVKPDLVVGASVGAIVGAAVCATAAMDDPQAFAHIQKLAKVFLHCDSEVALTRRLKNVTKQLGVRARSIDVSPRLLRRLVKEGSRKDSAYAITGAPPVLIEAISNLFLIPHQETQTICAKFISGHTTEAAQLFWKAVESETLRRLGIEDSVMGSELLEKAAKDLLFPDSESRRYEVQPYLTDGKGPAFFATSTHLSRKSTILLGRDFPVEVPEPERYDFLEACLCSSAFPVVFAPRSVSDVFPGLGRTDALLSDGGIFDNLPFFPAIGVMSEVQECYAKRFDGPQSLDYLRLRQEHPALLIAAGLDSNVAIEEKAPDDLFGIREMTKALSNNVKIGSFKRTSESVDKMTDRLVKAYENMPEEINTRFVNSMVPVSVLTVLPKDKEHLNGTFAFCRATGMDPEKMKVSIAHGCFQTLAAFARNPEGEPSLAKSMSKCRDEGRIALIEAVAPPSMEREGKCPYFQINGERPACPFHAGAEPEVQGIYEKCLEDEAHGGSRRKWWERLG